MRALSDYKINKTDPPRTTTVRACARPVWTVAIGVPLRLVFLFLTVAASQAAAQQAPPDDFEPLVEAVEKSFDARPGYVHGDLITRSQIADAVAALANAGFEFKDGNRIVEKGLPDNSFLARELSTPAGRKFMRNVARNQGGYARLDRLSSMPRGKQLVSDLIRKPGGEKLIEYLATTKGGRTMGAMVGSGRGGANLNEPTGRIYTAFDLIAELERRYRRGEVTLIEE